MTLGNIRIFSDFRQYHREHPGDFISLTIGNFDGCHLGHQELIRLTLQAASQEGCEPMVMSFTPRPEALFKNGTDQVRLATDQQKSRSFAELGIKRVLMQTFDQDFRQLTHQAFFSEVLLQALRSKVLTIGQDFRFGRGRTGDIAWLMAEAGQGGPKIQISPDITVEDQKVSSTRIREILTREGDVKTALHLLGRPYMLEGLIEPGDRIGRTLGFPTANLGRVNQIIPALGVYAGWVWLGDRDLELPPPVTYKPLQTVPAVIAISQRPTLGMLESPVRIEAHLLSGEYGFGALYGYRAGYYFMKKLRGDQRFASLEDLRIQIQKDTASARATLKLESTL